MASEELTTRSMATTNDHKLAHTLATDTGVLLIELRKKLLHEGAAATVFRHEGDKQAHEYLMNSLADNRPNDAILSEEGSPNSKHPKRLSTERTWIIDPLDGTREYSEPPRKDWAVHVALVETGEATVGAVALPGLGITFSTSDPFDAEKISLNSNKIKIAVSRTRPPAEAFIVAKKLNADLVEMGSAGAKAMAVVRGEVDAYIHTGGQYEWDSCAPVAVAKAVGLHTSRIDGSALTYNRPDPYLPDLVICRKELSKIILETIATRL